MVSCVECFSSFLSRKGFEAIALNLSNIQLKIHVDSNDIGFIVKFVATFIVKEARTHFSRSHPFVFDTP